ncbi:type I-E CRISPR-associated protein Cse1/CasA [Leptospirillum ferriphilum]
MRLEDRFNLIDEPWIPVTEVGLVSLKQLFSEPFYRSLGGSPIDKIALTKFLLAIAQTADTPESDEDWVMLTPEKLARECLSYLEERHDLFYLYGDRPFLQMPAIRNSELKPFGSTIPGIAAKPVMKGKQINTTILFQSEIEKNLTDGEKALLIVRLMGCALGGKQTDNSIVLSPGYTGKTNESGKKSSGKEGPFIGAIGYLHTFLQGNSLWETLWLNLFSRQYILGLGAYPDGVGTPPWEEMPTGEDCSIAKRLKSTLMGRLVPLSRFCLLEENGLYYSEGIAYPGCNEGGRDPSVSRASSGKNLKVLWTDPLKRPWRSLPSILSFVHEGGNKGFECYQIRLLGRAREKVEIVGIWSGGLRVKNTAGEQKVAESCDFVESLVWIPCKDFGTLAFLRLSEEMNQLENLSNKTFAAILNYFKDQKIDNAKQQTSQAMSLFWQLCEQRFQDLLNACIDTDLAESVRLSFTKIAERIYNMYCPRETSRQIEVWAKNRPDFRWYFPGKEKGKND